MPGVPKIGVYVCHCGSNIAATVDVAQVRDYAAELPNVAISRDYPYMCSEPGQKVIVEDVRNLGINRVVVASCSPRMHEPTFQKAVETAGLNRYLLEMANIRDHCSWVHTDDPERATEKAKILVKASVAKAAQLKPLTTEKLSVNPTALVIGGGIAGIRGSLDIANAGFEVYLVEKRPSIGGNMARLDKTFPTLDCSQCILTPLMVEVARHPKIHLYTYSEVQSVEGSVGNFTVTIEGKPRYVNEARCTGCGTCVSKCPLKVPSEFELGLGQRSAVYFEFPQAVPLIPVIDPEHCAYLTNGRCRACEKLCPTKAIDFEQKPREVKLNVGTIILATGYTLYDVANKMPEYEYARNRNVITGLQFERLCSATGPTKGNIQRLEDGKRANTVAIVLCAGSRDTKHLPYCCRFGCAAGLKHAYYVVSHIPEARVYICYTDIRSFGKGYEEFYERIRGYENVYFVRGRPAEIYSNPHRSLYFDVYDSNTNRFLRINPDLVVLETGVVPDPAMLQLGRMLKCSRGPDGFALELHPKLRPTETSVDGVFLAGVVQGPKDIPDTVAQAGAAASSAIALMSRGYAESVPYIAEVNEDVCSGCGVCEPLCAYNAISIVEKNGGKLASIDAAKCKGCGACAAGCPSAAMDQKGFDSQQILAMVEAITT